MRFNLSKEYYYRGNINDFEELLKLITPDFNTKIKTSFFATPIVNGEFKVTSKYSLGTLVGTGGAITKGITIYFNIIDSDSKTIKIRAVTKLRVELYFTILVALIFYIVMITSKEKIPFWVYFIPVIPVPWFLFVYRLQEINLLNKFSNTFGLEEIKQKKRIIKNS